MTGSASLWCVVLNISRVVPQHSLSSLLASSSNLTGLDRFFFKKLNSSVVASSLSLRPGGWCRREPRVLTLTYAVIFFRPSSSLV